MIYDWGQLQNPKQNKTIVAIYLCHVKCVAIACTKGYIALRATVLYSQGGRGEGGGLCDYSMTHMVPVT